MPSSDNLSIIFFITSDEGTRQSKRWVYELTSSVTFIKSVNQSSIKPCQSDCPPGCRVNFYIFYQNISCKNDHTRWLLLLLQSSTPSKDGLLAVATVDSVVVRDIITLLTENHQRLHLAHNFYRFLPTLQG